MTSFEQFDLDVCWLVSFMFLVISLRPNGLQLDQVWKFIQIYIFIWNNCKGLPYLFLISWGSLSCCLMFNVQKLLFYIFFSEFLVVFQLGRCIQSLLFHLCQMQKPSHWAFMRTGEHDDKRSITLCLRIWLYIHITGLILVLCWPLTASAHFFCVHSAKSLLVHTHFSLTDLCLQ